jgi:probable O-glycosylation ligase (exosortase A-associated)
LRLQAWGVAWNVALDHPFTGGGFEFVYVPDELWLSYAPFLVPFAENYARAAHSIYFQVLEEHGFPGLALYLAMLVTTLRALSKIKRNSRGTNAGWLSPLASSLQIGLAGYMVSGAFLSLAYFDLPYLFIVLTAVLQRECLVVSTATAKGTSGSGEHRLPELRSGSIQMDQATRRGTASPS